MVARWKLLGALCTACALTSLIAAAVSAGDSPRCAFKVVGPRTRPNQTLLSEASFHCTRAYTGAQARVAVQKQVKGHWRTVGQTKQTIDVAIGKSYTVTASVPCKATTNFTGVKIRTFFSLKASTFHFVLPSRADPALCRFES